ncbi:MAG: A/G-specific adenine glycosylase [Flavobacteriales bacterium AspAUS03]
MDFSEIMLYWYKTHHRELPWRKTHDPYHIWVSEIILQQTRVMRGVDYYVNFIAHFPTLSSLAQASEQEVLKAWEGLGYYSRARNLHFTAREIYKQRGEVFPQRYQELIQLNGIGTYTAAAIASICFKEPIPAIDGNAYRVLARHFGLYDDIHIAKTKKKFIVLGHQIIHRDAPGDFNQAVMELGSTLCTPKQAQCSQCPVNYTCFALQHKAVYQLPVKMKKIKVKQRFFYYLIVSSDQGVWLQRRTHTDIWKGLYEFPLIHVTQALSAAEVQEALYNEFGILSTLIHQSVHKLTHQSLQIEFWKGQIQKISKNKLGKFELIPLDALDRYPFPRPITLFLESEKMI